MVRIVSVSEAARRVAAVLPAIAVATTGVVLTAGAAPWGPTSALTVPDEALTEGASPPYPSAGPPPPPMQLPPIYRTFTDPFPTVDVPRSTGQAVRAIGSMAPVRIDAHGIPAPALAAYERAAALLRSVDAACGLDWALLGAIGRVESNHSRFGGNSLDSAGIARPGIIGIALDGSHGTARITDTDGGRWDRDDVFDRAVGPMQFIPGTWRIAGRDADGDGAMNPQSMADSAAAAGVYLCSGDGDLRDPNDAYAAVLRYNHSDDYARSVLSIAEAYRSGATVVPVAAIPAARPAEGSGAGTPEGSGFGWGGGSTPTSSPSSSSSSTSSPTATASRKSEPAAEPGDRTGSRSDPVPQRSATRDDPSSPVIPLPSLQRPTSTAPVPTAPAVPTVPLPVTTVPLPTGTMPTIEQLLALPRLPRLLGDPLGLVRVLSPVTGRVVCILGDAVVDCP
ncbi:hypothetical protein [Intrasporangium sp.]|uniref:lytic transglycosylase domain-containing protein n=1 Tax=Intrasporangium sp. TaxID=1925024 RepID=UPI00293B7535|nr:hypothetical protein [Intrasporangium sp.]MDV3222336.1 hypothetical protein [Intrasporangium sp.]